MANDRNDSTQGPAEPSSSERLNSWKEIAAYLKSSERTVRRWQDEGLPVHRHAHKKRAGVYAYRPELDAWWNNGHARLEEMERTQAAQGSRWASWFAVAQAAWKSNRFRWAALSGAIILVIGLAISGWLWYSRQARVLTEKDSIVLADFNNTTGDPVFDGTLRQALMVQLGQTPFLQITSDEQVRQTLRLMERPPDARLTPELAREVCQRANAAAEIEGSIAALGTQYVLGLNAVKCSTGETLAGEQITADRKEKVLAALTTAASNLRSRLGESRASLERFDAPLDQVTTPSLEALQAWTLGTRAFLNADIASAISFFQRAVTIDPNFAVAYSTMGMTYRVEGEYGPAIENATKAYNLLDRSSEREKFVISSNYHFVVTGNRDKALQICEQWTKIFPRDPAAFIGLEGAYSGTGRFDEALAAAREALRLNPTPWTYGDVADEYLLLGRVDEARATLRQGEANHVDPSAFRDELWWIASLQNDSAGMAEQGAGAWIGPPGFGDEWQSSAEAYNGHLSRARDLAQRAIAGAKREGASQVATTYQVQAALREVLFGDFAEARKAMKGAGNFMADRDLEGEAAIVLALSGDTTQAQSLADDLNTRFPEDTYVRFGSLPAIHGVLAIRRGNVPEAVEDLRAISSRELMTTSLATRSGLSMLPLYISGEAHLAAHQGPEAAAAFQMLVDHHFAAVTPALAHLGLGRAYALQGDTGKSRAAYQDFLTLWKDADPDIPILKQAKAEYARLK